MDVQESEPPFSRIVFSADRTKSFQVVCTPDPTLTVLCRWGLCNRLRVLLSGLALAESTGRAFRMYWPPHADCAASFSDLFENDWPVFHVEPVPAVQSQITFHLPWRRLPDYETSNEPSIGVEFNKWLIQSGVHPGAQAGMERCVEWFQSLVPRPFIRAACEEFVASHFRPRMIGVHVRRGDFVNAWARPHVSSSLTSTLKAVDLALGLEPEAGIFLCTDDGALRPRDQSETPLQGVAHTFRSRYGDRVVSYPSRSLDRTSVTAIEDALVDLLLLRKVDRFVGSAESSFSEMAALGREIPVTFCTGPTSAYERQERRLQRLGVHGIVMFLARRVLDPDVPFHFVWNIWIPQNLRSRFRLYARRS